MASRETKGTIHRWLKLGLIAAAWLLIWQLVSICIGSPLLLPPPLAVFKALLKLVVSTFFWRTVLYTFLRVFFGFLLGMATGSLLGIATAFSPALDAFLTPLKGLIRSTPVTSFIILVLLYLSSGITPLFIAFLTVVPIAWTNISTGVHSTNKNLLEAAKAFSFGKFKTFRFVYLPHLKPYAASAAMTALGFAWKSCIAAEVIASSKYSIGRALYESKLYLEVADLFAWTISVIILSLGIEQLLKLLLKNRRNNADN